ncbi:MerR family transcriptional regulator [Micromonospora sp. NPDC051543]|uniref:MerR family transcriptional regulator n=1 Tax=Micromonospora sp. NPDC051543 TaxID=3364287 RepID=UPI00379B6962
MRISALSRQTGTPVATIKFYLREGLLPPGTPTGRNQAVYGEEHRRRLQLIRAFTSLGELDLSSVRRLLAAIEDNQLPLPQLYEVADRTITQGEPTTEGTAEVQRARADVNALLAQSGWRVDAGDPNLDRFATTLVTLRELGCACGIDFFNRYAEMADQLAVQELDLLPSDGVGADRAAAIVRAVLLEVAFTSLWRLAREHHAAIRFSHATPGVPGLAGPAHRDGC